MKSMETLLAGFGFARFVKQLIFTPTYVATVAGGSATAGNHA
jgi:hypothetical protein